MMSLLKTLGFERLSTYEGEKKAAEILCEEIRTIGLTPVVETFMAPRYTVTNCSLTVTAPFEQSIPCTGYGFSGNDAKDGIEAEFQYIEGFEPIDLQNVKGKIVLITQGLTISGYVIAPTSSVIASRRALRSPYGTCLKPAGSGE